MTFLPFIIISLSFTTLSFFMTEFFILALPSIDIPRFTELPPFLKQLLLTFLPLIITLFSITEFLISLSFIFKPQLSPSIILTSSFI
ncbi:MAG: hypothetical protein DSY60_04435 [Persephonella sp.]|nr:MAG: hypothetical protein DSY60_04435 [Persephonella sp.]